MAAEIGYMGLLYIINIYFGAKLCANGIKEPPPYFSKSMIFCIQIAWIKIMTIDPVSELPFQNVSTKFIKLTTK